MWSQVQGEIWSFTHVMGVIGRVSQGAFVTGQLAWEKGPWLKKWSCKAGGYSLMGLFGSEVTVLTQKGKQ